MRISVSMLLCQYNLFKAPNNLIVLDHALYKADTLAPHYVTIWSRCRIKALVAKLVFIRCPILDGISLEPQGRATGSVIRVTNAIVKTTFCHRGYPESYFPSHPLSGDIVYFFYMPVTNAIAYTPFQGHISGETATTAMRAPLCM